MIGTSCVAKGKLSVQTVKINMAFAIGATVGGLLMGLAISTVNFASQQLPFLSMVTVTLVLLVLEDAGRWKVSPPSWKRQVSPVTSVMHNQIVTYLMWGVELGIGALTHVNTWALWAMICLIFWVGDVGYGLLLGLAYGLTRGLQPLATTLFTSDRGFGLTDKTRAVLAGKNIGAVIGITSLALLLQATAS